MYECTTFLLYWPRYVLMYRQSFSSSPRCWESSWNPSSFPIVHFSLSINFPFHWYFRVSPYPPRPPIWVSVSVSQCSECGSGRSSLATACYKSKYPDGSGSDSGSPDMTRLWHSVTHITCAPWHRAQGKVVASEGIVKSAEKCYIFILSLVLLEIVQCNRMC